ncbi:MAG: glycosyl hydrolase, partial [Gammaproteobacteria bacterium]|nr:glycosyl hydrolase [Gammaproteobacteria bacterium]
NPDVILASLNHHVTYPWDEESGGPTTGLFRSADGGKSWTDITRNPGMPGGMVGKIGIAISPADSMRVYAFIEADEGEGGIYRSDDGGASWQMTHQDLYGLEIPNSYNHITADPEDPDIVYIQPISGFQKSVDGGHTFEHINHLNWDPHALWIDPGDPRRMIEGGDGGATVTLNGGETWSSLENQPTADLLSLAVDDQHPYWVYGAQNDNSHIAIPSATDAPAIGSRHYRPLPVGEGGQTAVTPDGQVIYANDRARMFRIDRDVGQAEDVSVWPEVEFGTAVKDVRYRFYYTFPILRSLHGAGTLYTAAQFVFRSNDEGQNWGRISPDLTRNRQDVMGEVSGGPISSNASSLFHVSLVRTIAESPLKEGELWIGTDDSTVQYTRDGGETWQDVSPAEMPEWTTITGIDVSHHAPGTVYLSGERHRVSDRTPYLYRTTDSGRTWRRITNGIRQNDYSWVVREDPVRPGLLFAGTETGVYVSFDAGNNWRPLQGNLPPVLVMHMAIKDDDLVLATHGRGFWILDNMSYLRGITPDVVTSSAFLFDVATADRRLRGGRGWTRINSRVVAKNPPYGVVVDYYLAQASGDEVALTFLDSDNKVIRRYSSSDDAVRAAAGMNRFVWDMQYPAVELPLSAGALPNFESSDHSPPSPPVALPGAYRVQLTVGEQSLEKPFDIRKDPRTRASDADLMAQFELMTAIQARVSEVTDVVNRIREARAEVTSRRAGLLRADAILADLDEIEGELTIWMGSEAHPMMFGPPGLIQKLSRLSGAVISADARPTPAMYGVFNDLSERLEAQEGRFSQVIGQLQR